MLHLDKEKRGKQHNTKITSHNNCRLQGAHVQHVLSENYICDILTKRQKIYLKKNIIRSGNKQNRSAQMM